MYKYCHLVCLLFIETLHRVQYLGACRATLELRSLSWDMTHETIKTLRHRPKEPPDQSAWSVPTTLVDHTMERLYTAMNLLAQYCCCDILRTRVVAFKRAGQCLDQSEGGTLTTLNRPDIVFSGLDCWLCLFLNKLAGFNWTTGCVENCGSFSHAHYNASLIINKGRDKGLHSSRNPVISTRLRIYTTFVLPVVARDRRYPISSKNERRRKIKRSQKSKLESSFLRALIFLTFEGYCCIWLTNATIFSKFRLQASKPIMEKRRRARINESLNELKTLILEAMKKDVGVI